MPAISEERLALERLRELFRATSGLSPEVLSAGENTITALPASGSGRRYYRISAGSYSLIGTWNPNVEENRAFIGMARHFRARGLPVPEVYAHSEDLSCYLQTDLGDRRLFDLLPVETERPGLLAPKLETHYKEALDLLLRLQFEGAKDFDYSLCRPVQLFDEQAVLFDLYYFKYYFLKLFNLPFDELALEGDLHRLAQKMTQEEPFSFQHRDYQSRNLMIHDGRLYVIDFQGGRRGEPLYDLVSLSWQARARIPMEQRRALFDYYVQNMRLYHRFSASKDYLFERYLQMALLRTLQVLGAYGLRGRVEGKSHFYKSIVPALENLRYLLSELNVWGDFPALRASLQRAVEEMPEGLELLISGAGQEAAEVKDAALKVYVSSFSYKRGLPADVSGSHGGGFIFDCRFLDNPGRLEAYRELTGKDKAVQQFLLERRETHRFLKRVKKIVDEAVDKYLSRKFDSLQVHFGCTGGQHRSVFMAEMLARHLRDRDVKVLLEHREQCSVGSGQ